MAADNKKAEMRKVTPHLWNLNEDSALEGMIVYLCEEGNVLTLSPIQTVLVQSNLMNGIVQ